MFIKERNKGLSSILWIIYNYRKYYLNVFPVEMQTLMRFIFLLRSGNTPPHRQKTIYIRQIIHLMIYFRFLRMILALFIAGEIRICNCKLLENLSLYICIQAVRLPLGLLVLLGWSPLSNLIGALSAYEESHSYYQPATAVTVSLSLSHVARLSTF